MITEIQVPTRPWIQGVPSIVQTDQHGRTFLEIHNASPTPRQLQANEIMGIAQPVDPVQLFPLIGIIEQCPNINAIKHKMITEEDKRFIKNKASIMGSPDEIQRYLDIFYLFPNIFSRHKNDLGQCDLLQHKIHLKTEEPEGHKDAVKQQVTEWLKLGIYKHPGHDTTVQSL
jgi:hypothetical protein